MKILVIEDEVLLAKSIKALLENKGFDVECVYDGDFVKLYKAPQGLTGFIDRKSNSAIIGY